MKDFSVNKVSLWFILSLATCFLRLFTLNYTLFLPQRHEEHRVFSSFFLCFLCASVVISFHHKGTKNTKLLYPFDFYVLSL